MIGELATTVLGMDLNLGQCFMRKETICGTTLTTKRPRVCILLYLKSWKRPSRKCLPLRLYLPPSFPCLQ